MKSYHTPQSLNEDILRFRVSPSKAKENIEKFRDYLNDLIYSANDELRIENFNKLKKMIFDVYSDFDLLLYWSKIGTSPEEYWKNNGK